jgi:branched-chain amino acid transport system permease protein
MTAITPTQHSIVKATGRKPLALLPAALMIVVLIGLAAGPLFLGRSELRLLIEVFSYLALAQMWNLLAGYAGLISVGQQAFVGLGGYVFFALTILAGVPVMAALPLTGLIVGAIAIPTGLLAFRLRGAYFAIGTWVIAEVYRLLAVQAPGLGGGSGISLPTDIVKSVASSRDLREFLIYWIALALALASILIVWRLLRSRWGLALTAIRDSEVASQSLGIRTLRTKFVVYVMVAGFSAVVGAFIFLQKLRISPDAAFSVNEWSAFVIFIVVIGGVGTIEGPVIGVVVFFLLRELLADWGTWNFIVMGLVAMAVMLVDKRGIWGALVARGVMPLLQTKRIFKPKAHMPDA